MTDPIAQIEHGNAYIRERYGSPAAAVRSWQEREANWYVRGGSEGR